MVGKGDELLWPDTFSYFSSAIFVCTSLDKTQKLLLRFLWEPRETRRKMCNCSLTPESSDAEILSSRNSFKVLTRAVLYCLNLCVQIAVSVVTVCFVSDLLANFLAY